jgi:hypothetical protein
MSDYPPVLVTACCDPDHGKAKEDIFGQPFVPDLIVSPHLIPQQTIRESCVWLDEHAQQYTYALLLHDANENKRAD